MAGHFNRKFFDFFRELGVNNERAWFNDNKARYEEIVLAPLMQFVEDFAPRLKKISKNYLAIPKRTGGSIFRIYRDTRFGKDKTPYKTHAAAQFRHSLGKDVHAPGFYLHLGPGEVFGALGLWRPDPEPLRAIRQRIADDPKSYLRAINDKKFSAAFSLGGSTLKRPPKDFDKDHPQIEAIKRKDFIASAKLTERDACRADFIDRYTEICRAGTPFMKFLNKSIDVPW